MIERIRKRIRRRMLYYRGLWRFRTGTCPACNSDAPALYDCPVCDGDSTFIEGAPRALWMVRYRVLLESNVY